MYTLAQYVFGYGKTETNCPPTSMATTTPIPTPELCTKAAKSGQLAANNSNECVQSTNIENDWILIDVAEGSAVAAGAGAAAAASSKKKASSSSKGKQQQQLAKAALIKKKADPLADSRLSLDNIFGEHPCLSVFDNLFTYRPPTVEIPATVVAFEAKKKEVAAVAKPMAVATIAKVPAAKLKKAAAASSTTTTNNNKKKAATNGAQQQQLSQQIFSTFSLKATTASKDEALSNNNKKQQQQQSKSLSKKVTDRSNKVAMQRNGPIIRAKKMFTNFNGIYNNRNAC